ncbi:MAG: hypothetical protein BRC29_00260 [Nanohaloarchaea archaeon SW_7_43_1]|nr:MAG: hypothetical protein BRC29_00260 [Nanohaloarchaea archaeon SW_7_43_1]
MIREYAPVGLIPAAWAMTFGTIIYPGLDTYWIQHMHYFVIFFLSGFTALSWKEMDSPVLGIWRNVIAAGIIFTGLGALSFVFTSYSSVLGFLSLSYWFLAPGTALYFSSRHMDKYSKLYQWLAGKSAISYVILVLGLYTEVTSLQVISFAGIAVVQAASITTASRLDEQEQS